MPTPEAVATPWDAAATTATDVVVPPDRLRGTALLVEFVATVLLTGPAIGAEEDETVMLTVPGAEVPPGPVAV
jgi:hypothetical protein